MCLYTRVCTGLHATLPPPSIEHGEQSRHRLRGKIRGVASCVFAWVFFHSEERQNMARDVRRENGSVVRLKGGNANVFETFARASLSFSLFSFHSRFSSRFERRIVGSEPKRVSQSDIIPLPLPHPEILGERNSRFEGIDRSTFRWTGE